LELNICNLLISNCTGWPKKAENRLVCRVSAFLDHPVHKCELYTSTAWRQDIIVLALFWEPFMPIVAELITILQGYVFYFRSSRNMSER